MLNRELRGGLNWTWVVVPLIVLAGGLWAATGHAHGQEKGSTNVEVTAYTDVLPDGRLSLGEITVGRPVTIEIKVTHPPTSQITLPRPPAQWDEVFEVLSQSAAKTTGSGDRRVTSKSIEVALFAPGEHEIPPLVVEVRDSEGTIWDQPVPTVPLDVVPVLGEDDEQLVDIRPQADMTGPLLDLEDIAAPSNWPWIVGALALMGLAGWGLYTLLRPRTPEPVFISPYDAAITELERIEGLGLPAAGRFKEHYTLVADVMRAYLEGEFAIPALDRTTSEIQAAVSKADIPMEGAVEMRWLFVDCDIVKFTGLEPDEYEAGLMVGRGREILEMIRPAETPPEPEGTGQLAEVPGA